LIRKNVRKESAKTNANVAMIPIAWFPSCANEP